MNNLVVTGSKVEFLSPIRVGEDIEFNAITKNVNNIKKEVDVVGKYLDIEVFKGTFFILALPRNPLKIDVTKRFND